MTKKVRWHLDEPVLYMFLPVFQLKHNSSEDHHNDQIIKIFYADLGESIVLYPKTTMIHRDLKPGREINR